MPGKVPMDLYIASSLADLNEKSSIKNLNHPVKQIVKSAQQLHDNAKKSILEGDEEKSYVLFMKFVEVAIHVRRTKGLQEKEFDEKFGRHLKHAMKTLEQLEKSLASRYSKKKEIEEKSKHETPQTPKLVQEDQDKNAKELPNGSSVPPYFDTSISSLELHKLIKEGKYTILVLDVRSQNDYSESHMSFNSGPMKASGLEIRDKARVINVPKEIVVKGLIPSSLEKALPPESLQDWRKRNEVDYIILMDWESDHSSMKPDSTLAILKDIMTKWETNFSYKQNPLILERGYFDWINTYPMMSTNPHVDGPPKPKSMAALILNRNALLSSLIVEDDILDDLDEVVYPSLVESPPKVTPTPYVGNQISSQSTSGGTPAPEKRTVPVVDRSSKPNTTISSPQKLPTAAAVFPKVSLRNLSPSQPPYMRSLSSETSDSDESPGTSPKNNDDFGSQGIKIVVSESPVTEVEPDAKEINEKKKTSVSAVDQVDPNTVKPRKIPNIPPVDRSLKAKVLQQNVPGEDEEDRNLLKSMGASSGQKPSPVIVRRDSVEDKPQPEIRKPIDDVEKQRKNLKPLPSEKKEEENRPAKKKFEQDIWTTPLKSEPSHGSSSMKRSHSFQNVSRLVDDIEIPKFNRSSKPVNRNTDVVPNRRRNFEGVYGNVGRGLTGLRNLGNSCYMNSILQCINHTQSLVQYFCNGQYRDDVNRSTKMRGEVADEVAALVRALWSGEYRSIACRDLKGVVGLHKKAFAGYEQQDSHEFLTILMDWLHEDLNRARRKPVQNEIRKSEESTQNVAGSEGAIKAWKEFCRQNESLVLQLFYGQQASTVRCLHCAEESVTYEPFSNLSLPIPPNTSRCTLADCMSLYLKGEHITGWNCPRCKEPRDAIKKFDIWILPKILVVHFKRFTSDGWCRKRQTCVDFPLEDLDVSEWVEEEALSSNQRKYSSLYNLYGISNHYGTMNGGHYTAYCKSNIFNKWYKFDDQEVTELSPSDVVSPAAYILFYSSVDVS